MSRSKICQCFCIFIIITYLSVAVLKQTGASRMKRISLFLHVVDHHLTFNTWCIVDPQMYCIHLDLIHISDNYNYPHIYRLLRCSHACTWERSFTYRESGKKKLPIYSVFPHEAVFNTLSSG